MKVGECFVEVEYTQRFKHGEPVNGDVFLSRRDKENKRTFAVLADGLGSGVKANVLATLTSTMALKFIENGSDMLQVAKTMMAILPICKIRKIGYSTFTIVEILPSGLTTIIDFENPAFLIIRNGLVHEVTGEAHTIPPVQGSDRPRQIFLSSFQAQPNDRIILCSDGVTQSGIGTINMMGGWKSAGVRDFTLQNLNKDPKLSARELSRCIVHHASINDGQPKDDITCAVIYFRHPRKMMLISGPPFLNSNDAKLAAKIKNFPGSKVVCGGTTAKIIAREFNKTLKPIPGSNDPNIPPASMIDGIDLVSEGMITLRRVFDLLQSPTMLTNEKSNAAVMVTNYLLNSDNIEFHIGTKINQVYQDPTLIEDIELRRNIIKKIIIILKEKYLKEIKVYYL